MKIRITCLLMLLTCLVHLSGLAAAQHVMVPGDLNGDKNVSSEELAQAEQKFKDEKISQAELDQIKIIHDSYPRTITDSAGNRVTIYKPIERIAILSSEDYEIARILKVTDKVVAASKYIVQSKENGCGSLYADGKSYANIGTPVGSLDYEALIKSNPDLVITYVTSPKAGELENNLKGTGMTILRLDSGNISQYIGIVKKLGYLLDKNKEAEDYAEFFDEKLGKYINAVADLSENEKPSVYLEADFGGGQTYYTCGIGHAHNALIVAAGAHNLFSSTMGFKQVDPESVAMQNPQVILIYKYLKDFPGIDQDRNNTAPLKALCDAMMKRPELQKVDAVKNKRVYMFTWDATRGGGRFYLGMGYIGKWLQPQIFMDYNPREVYQEYLKKYQGVDVDLTKNGVFVYPET